MEQWEKNFYISAIAGASNGSSLVVMSKGRHYLKLYTFISSLPCSLSNELLMSINAGTQYAQQSYKVSDSFPFKWINKKWREGFFVTSMATAGSRWAVVMSRNAGFSDQVFVQLVVYYWLAEKNHDF